MNPSMKAALLGIAVMSHLTDFYIVGETLFSYPANVPSLMFVLAMALLLVEHDLTPMRIRRWNSSFIISYNLLAMTCMTSMVVRYVWLPLSLRVIQLNFYLAQALSRTAMFQKPPLHAIVMFLTCPNWQKIELTILATSFLIMTIKETDAFDLIETVFIQMRDKCEEIGVSLYVCDCETSNSKHSPNRRVRPTSRKRR